MDPKEKSSGRRSGGNGYGYRSSSSGYGYGYGSSYGYGAAYGYGEGAGSTVVQRSLQDYLLVIRERFWYILIVFLVVAGLSSAFTFTRLPLYQSIATIQIFRRTPTVMQMQQVLDSGIASAEDLNTQINILKSKAIIDGVAERMSPDLRKQFLAPYMRTGAKPPSLTGILSNNRDIISERLSLILDVEYKHPNPIVAAQVANLFADAYSDYNTKIRVDQSMRAVEELRQRANDQRKKVDEIASNIQVYREKNHLVSLNPQKDIVTETLKELNTLVTQSAATLQSAEIRWNQVQEAQKAGHSLLDLPFIASSSAVAQLQTQVATQRIAVAQLGQRYRPKHPMMIQAQKSLDEATSELAKAIQTSTAQIESDYQTALRNYAKAQSARSFQEKESLSLDRYGLEYSNLERDYEVNEKILEQILDLQRMRQTASTATDTIENENARTVDRALPAARPFYPNYLMYLGVGVGSGIGLGFAVAFLVAYLDDRIKSAFDIETVVGLPLLGIIPEVKQLGSAKNGEVLSEQRSDRALEEAFSTLMSALKLKDESKGAQCILVTSTIAGEGKSFIASHLAATYASHGDKVVVVDCDLRRPAVNRAFHLENLKGVIDICTDRLSIDDVVFKDVKPNLDVIVTGGRSKNPTQTLNSKEFAQLISDLRKRYTKIFIDTPPIAIVSDALMILPLMDGSLYAIFFNKARRRTAAITAQRLLELNVPCFGAVLNGLRGGIGGYYYAHYYDRSYKDYYVKHAETVKGKGDKIVEN